MSEEFKGLVVFSLVGLAGLTVIASGCNAYNYMSFRDIENQRSAEFEYRKWMSDKGMVEVIESTPGQPTVARVWKKASE